MCGSDVAGGFIALGGAELKLARKADAVALPGTVPADELRAMMQRMANGANLFSPVAEDEYYLSKLGLNGQFRGRGLSSGLIERYLEEGMKRGYSRYCLEVRSNNEPAIRLYRS
ncbi:MAG: GNAT family N-acetyltransferase, partial [Candidatus Binataceae bacterium]